MSELDMQSGQQHNEQSANANSQADDVTITHKNWQISLVKVAKWVDGLFPNYRTPDAMAVAVARRTPTMVVICAAILFISIIGSLLHVWQEDFLWGIPALGAVALAIGFWIWTSNLKLRSDLSEEARETLQRAVRLQWAAIGGGILTMVYFFLLVAGVF